MRQGVTLQTTSPSAESRLQGRGWVGTLNLEILKTTSPELAIKIAYDFGRSLRASEGDDLSLSVLLDKWVTTPFQDNPLQRYIKAGFTAGFNFEALPWKRQIDEAAGPDNA